MTNNAVFPAILVFLPGLTICDTVDTQQLCPVLLETLPPKVLVRNPSLFLVYLLSLFVLLSFQDSMFLFFAFINPF